MNPWPFYPYCTRLIAAHIHACLQVSLDLRAIARSKFNPGFVDRRGHPLSRRIGEFYFESKLAAPEGLAGE